MGNEVIVMKNISKQFRVLNRREGLKGSIRDLFSRDYRIVKAVDDVSLTVDKGEIIGYLGPNGAGKSTTIKIMTGRMVRRMGGALTYQIQTGTIMRGLATARRCAGIATARR